jgi:hypothetical protein
MRPTATALEHFPQGPFIILNVQLTLNEVLNVISFIST